MLKKKKIAARYAHVLLAQAIQNGTLASINSGLSFLHNQFRDHPTLDRILNNPTLPHADKRKLLKKIYPQELSPMLWRFLEIIMDQYQIGLLKEIVMAFIIAYRAHIGIQSATVTTAVALPEALITSLITEVKKWVNCTEVVMEQRLDPSIIGGYILQIGTIKLDKSIKNGLHALQRALHE